jgi:hypothetical protein
MKRNPLSGMNAMRGKLPVPEPPAEGDENRGDGFGVLEGDQREQIGGKGKRALLFKLHRGVLPSCNLTLDPRPANPPICCKSGGANLTKASISVNPLKKHGF